MDYSAFESRYNNACAEGLFNAAENVCRELLKKDPASTRARKMLEAITQERVAISASSYTQDFLRNRIIFQKYPRIISIETAGFCNAGCGFCPHSRMSRNKSSMTDDLFEKILCDIRQIPESFPVFISPNVINEPFLDNKLFLRLSRINEVVPHAQLAIYTNLSIMTDSLLDRLLSIRSISAINISFNAANKTEYERSMRLPFEKTVKNILSLLEWNKKSSGHVKRIVLSRVMESNSSDRQFLKECEKLFSPFIPGKEYYLFLKAKSNWLGAVDCSASPVPYPFPCAGWFDINILCNGVVPHCCQDVEGKYSLGNVLESSLLDIYNGPFRKLRDTSTTREDITPCNQCSILQ